MWVCSILCRQLTGCRVVLSLVLGPFQLSLSPPSCGFGILADGLAMYNLYLPLFISFKLFNPTILSYFTPNELHLYTAYNLLIANLGVAFEFCVNCMHAGVLRMLICLRVSVAAVNIEFK